MSLKKKMKASLFVGLIALSLTACGSQVDSGQEPGNQTQDQNQNNGNVVKEPEGEYTFSVDKKGVNISQTQGPVKYTIYNIRVATFKPDETYKNSYKGKDVLTYVEMDFGMENTGTDKISILPMSAKLLFDDKTQEEMDPLKSDASESELSGNAKIQGKYAFYIADENNAKHFKLFCRGPVSFTDDDATEYDNYELDIKVD